MKAKRKNERNSEYLEYKKIDRIIENAYKKALNYKISDFQKKLEKAFSSCT